MITLTINGEPRDVDVPAEMPLLWVLRDVLALTGNPIAVGAAVAYDAVVIGNSGS